MTKTEKTQVSELYTLKMNVIIIVMYNLKDF